MRILMTGATGLIGRPLGQRLAARGDTLICLVRDLDAARRRLPFPAECHAWDHRRPVPAAALRGVDAVINLAGEPVADTRWTAAKKALIRDSRVQGTRQLVRAVLQDGAAVAVLVHGSAIGYYGDRGDQRLAASSTWARTSRPPASTPSCATACWAGASTIRPMPSARSPPVIARSGPAACCWSAGTTRRADAARC
jgi:NAD dependent epimerase/dehydratase family enzyme